jgi:hypothetical protein
MRGSAVAVGLSPRVLHPATGVRAPPPPPHTHTCTHTHTHTHTHMHTHTHAHAHAHTHARTHTHAHTHTHTHTCTHTHTLCTPRGLLLAPQDPSDKRYALSDDTLQQLTGQKRFLLFGSQKLFRKHFLG